jgi:RNA polymerase sigma-70 factor (ECF subfamily)
MRNDQFERLYAEHASPLLGFLVYRTGDRALAEDLLADTFERVFRTRVRFNPRRGSEKTWVYSIALNCLRDHVRKAKTEARALERVVEPAGVLAEPAPLDAVHERDALERALERLAPEEREALALRYGGDLTVPEVARVTSEKLTTIEGRVHRGLRKLRDELR